MTAITLYSAEQTRDLDRAAILEEGIPGYELMSRAGAVAYEALRRRWPECRSLVLLCGPGNNGGDGYVIGRLARQDGLGVALYRLASPPVEGGDAHQAMVAFVSAGGQVKTGMPTDCDPGEIRHVVLVDALLGTGLDRPVSGAMGEGIAWLNRQPVPCLAVDIPSGLNADTGMPMGDAVRAALTVSFIGRKKGLYTGLAANYRGDLVFRDLGVPARIYERVSSDTRLLRLGQCLEHLPPRLPADHKGVAGHALLVGGYSGMAGAIRLAGEAAGRVGAGLTSVATLPENVAAVIAGRPEMMVHGCRSAEDLKHLMRRADAIAVGPGLGRSSWGLKLLTPVLDCGLPLVLDADALNLLAADPLTRDNWVLTPHPGEAARLLDCSVEEINRDRFAAVRELQSRYGGICVLKGSGTLITDGEGVFVSQYGNAGMATGGMGDVLSGAICGLLVQGMEPLRAAQLGVCLHGKAADQIAAELGQRGMLAGDLPYRFPMLLRSATERISGDAS